MSYGYTSSHDSFLQRWPVCFRTYSWHGGESLQMVAGIPYVYFLDGNPNRVQTVGCLQMLESLQWYPDFQEIYDMCIQLAKLSRGCPEQDGNPDIRRLSRLDGLKRNARSSKTTFAADSTDGSYNLKGEGQGVVLPAVQVDTYEGTALF
jgi:hypothetical protein